MEVEKELKMEVKDIRGPAHHELHKESCKLTPWRTISDSSVMLPFSEENNYAWRVRWSHTKRNELLAHLRSLSVLKEQAQEKPSFTSSRSFFMSCRSGARM